MVFQIGPGTSPAGLSAELDWSKRVLKVMDGEKELCTIPISDLLLLRERVADEIRPYLMPKDTESRRQTTA